MQTIDSRITRLRKALDMLTDFSVYPAAWDGAYEKRTEYMEGWNACAMDALKRLQEVHLEPGDWEDADRS